MEKLKNIPFPSLLPLFNFGPIFLISELKYVKGIVEHLQTFKIVRFMVPVWLGKILEVHSFFIST